METPDKEELIAGISALLKVHEEPYEVGAWENFNSIQKRRKPLLWVWLGAAAALAVIISVVIPEFMQPQVPLPVIVKHQPVEEVNTPEIPVGHLPERTENIAVVPERKQKKENRVFQRHSQYIADTTIKEKTMVVNNVAAHTAVPKTSVQPTEPVKKAEPKEDNLMRYSQSESHNVKISVPKEPSKWNFGVEIMPTVVQSKVTLGAGLTTEYKLSKRFSLSSGIAYVALDASKSIDYQPVSLMSSKKLIAIDANISAIDIPLSITYSLNKKIYTSMGVSYFNVLNEKRNNKYETQMEVAMSAKSSETGVINTYQSQLTEENTEVSSDLSLKGNGYLGFFNFSIGHKQEVFNQNHIVIEPFIKVPLGKLSNEDLRLSNGGVKLRFTF